MTTLTLQPDATDGLDAHPNNVSPTSTSGTSGSIIVGEYNTGARIERGFVKFDLSLIPAGAIISSAILSLWHHFDETTNTRSLRVYRVNRAWVEAEVTWNNWKSGSAWTTAGAGHANDAEATDIGSISLTATEASEFKDITLTASKIEEMIPGGGFTNNGFLLKMDTESNDAHWFRSSDYATAGERPKLVVDYTAPVGGPPEGNIIIT